MGEIAAWTPEDEANWIARVTERQEWLRATNFRFGTIGEHELGPVTTNGAWFIVDREDDLAYYGRWKTGCWPPGEVRFPKSQYTFPIDNATRDKWVTEAAEQYAVLGGYDWPKD